MAKLHFEWIDSAHESRAEYRGLIIRAVQDSDCSNPWEDTDGMAPLIYYSDALTDCAGSYDLESPLKRFSDYALGRKWRRLCLAIGVDPGELESEIASERKDYGGKLADWRRDKLEERLGELKPSSRSWGVACDYFTALEDLWNLAGIEALDFERNGYSQGDSVRGLLVALPEWRKAMGVPDKRDGRRYDMRADLEAQADVFGAWAFGDCFGYVIEQADSDGDPDGETLDSCWGFIGDDFEKSGLAEQAQSSADYIVESAAKRKAAKLKELIRNHVPLHARPAILADAAKLESC